MDVQVETRRFKYILYGAIIFIGSGCWTWGELVYLVRGQKTLGQVTEVYTVRERSGPTPMIDFTFTEPNGSARTGKDTIPADSIFQAGTSIAVQYTPGEKGRARRAGHVNWVALATFGVAASLLGFATFRLIREGQDYSRARQRTYS